jgi:hypothetical protein
VLVYLVLNYAQRIVEGCQVELFVCSKLHTCICRYASFGHTHIRTYYLLHSVSIFIYIQIYGLYAHTISCRHSHTFIVFIDVMLCNSDFVK